MTSTLLRLSTFRPQGPAWLWACVAVLLLAVAPLLGAVHQVVHPVATHVQAQVQGLGSGHPHVHAQAAGRDWTQHLFGDHAHDGDCRLFDQLCHADAGVSTAALVLPLLPPAWLQAWRLGEFLFRWTALFDARGPPSSR